MSSRWVAPGAGTGLVFLINRLKREGAGFPSYQDAFDAITELAGKFGWQATTTLELLAEDPLQSYDVERMAALTSQPEPRPFKGPAGTARQS